MVNRINALAAADTTDCCGLHELGIGCRGCVVGIAGEPELRRRLLEMGLCSGTEVHVVRRAPMNDPIELRVRGYSLSLRGEQAKNITIRPTV